ncbi:hypothetical protein PR048_000065 [Dryococelus australis]|uniref:Uncharacterized protein n=1 Tax=Dryococelus australis TaxID=614101 RepID=A0ABQ9IFT0_9NEOP|nr:hypothetical protein PR048_000065 [Dryococelus australis]
MYHVQSGMVDDVPGRGWFARRFQLVSSGSEMDVHFHSDYSVSGAGFAASWQAVDVSGCPSQTLTAAEGSLASPNYPHFLIPHLDCATTVLAPEWLNRNEVEGADDFTENHMDMLVPVVTLETTTVASVCVWCSVGKRVWLEFAYYDLEAGEALLELDLGSEERTFQPYQIPGHLTDGAYISHGERLQIQLRTGDKPHGKGFKATYRTGNPPTNGIVWHDYHMRISGSDPAGNRARLAMMGGESLLLCVRGMCVAAVSRSQLERVVNLTNVSSGAVRQLNFPGVAPVHTDFVQHLQVPLGSVILLELYGVAPGDDTGCPGGGGVLEVVDNYADVNGTSWLLCEARGRSAPLAIASYLNTLHVRQHSWGAGLRLNGTLKVQPDSSYKLKLLRGSEDGSVESCHPNPCQNGGKCVSRGQRNSCQCISHFTGMFCALTMCELEPCLFGRCQLTATSFSCSCQTGYSGKTCEEKQQPCADNPCEGRGECVYKDDDSFYCRCHAWWEGKPLALRSSRSRCSVICIMDGGGSVDPPPPATGILDLPRPHPITFTPLPYPTPFSNQLPGNNYKK